MKKYLVPDEWRIIESGFDPSLNKLSESIFSIGNGFMGQRANFEEDYSGETLKGSYFAGVYYPDKTRVGWWKNGYPEYFAKVLNAVNWIGIRIAVDGVLLDLATSVAIEQFTRTLHLKEGWLSREFVAELHDGKRVSVKAKRFCSMAEEGVGAISYELTPLNFDGTLTIEPYLDGNVRNEDANYDEIFWDEAIDIPGLDNETIVLRTRKTGFVVASAMRVNLFDASLRPCKPARTRREKYVSLSYTIDAKKGRPVILEKICAHATSRNHPEADTARQAIVLADLAFSKGFRDLLDEHRHAWDLKWALNDIRIDGDIEAQQGIRFNIFQLHQTYSGKDARLNIGPKGFTGEKYGGSTYWDTEAYCLPFYLSTAQPEVSRNLLLYRYEHLQKAIENAALLGFGNGAALYPMVTMNGEECHNEWEITFEEIHRNGAIAFAIFNYTRFTGDEEYVMDQGLEVLIAISRFWAQRVNWSSPKQRYVMLGVTGPNEYENNVNNNWYTNTLAVWCLEYTLDRIARTKQEAPFTWKTLQERTGFEEVKETALWHHIIENMYLPEDAARGIFLQQEGYLDKEQLTVNKLSPADRPLNQNWSWDRILRSCFIKQADVLQGLYLFSEKYDLQTLKRNFDFYEPRTVHESSLSPCVHAILAAKIGDADKAYEMYLRTSRLDLDDYNNDTEDGLHITSMAGTWMSIVEGFAGMTIKDGALEFNAFLPEHWKSYTFNIVFRGMMHTVTVSESGTNIETYPQLIIHSS